MWLDPFCQNLELPAQVEHKDELLENLSEIADLWNSPTCTHMSPQARGGQASQGARVILEDYLLLKKLFAQQMVQEASSCHSSISELIHTELDKEPGDNSQGQGCLCFCHKLSGELKGPDRIHMVHGSMGTLLATNLNSLPEDDQKGLDHSPEMLTTAEATALECNTRTESAKSIPLHKLHDVIMENPLEIMEL
ncbi:Cadherin-23 [Saguinus oedipus]|uniref:Cadherin-23 n=1 Tax=Saguinus oedipus TaxID=9490 RepID=A0ABQ9U8B8_SAGOE|nr:Cadherin-23 [Saguinus oedipus]